MARQRAHPHLPFQPLTANTDGKHWLAKSTASHTHAHTRTHTHAHAHTHTLLLDLELAVFQRASPEAPRSENSFTFTFTFTLLAFSDLLALPRASFSARAHHLGPLPPLQRTSLLSRALTPQSTPWLVDTTQHSQWSTFPTTDALYSTRQQAEARAAAGVTSSQHAAAALPVHSGVGG
jgi:hypothetical protein